MRRASRTRRRCSTSWDETTVVAGAVASSATVWDRSRAAAADAAKLRRFVMVMTRFLPCMPAFEKSTIVVEWLTWAKSGQTIVP
jgi:hypothetical protein